MCCYDTVSRGFGMSKKDFFIVISCLSIVWGSSCEKKEREVSREAETTREFVDEFVPESGEEVIEERIHFGPDPIDG